MYLNLSEDLETIKTSPKSNNEEKILQGADGTKYLYSPFLTEEDGKKVEEKTGVLLKREKDGKVSSFLGGGAFGRFYVIKNLSNGVSCGMKIISNNIEESQFEAKIQIDLSNKVNKEESRLMPLFDVIEEKDDNGKVVQLYLVMPLVSFINVKELRNKLKEEKDEQLKSLAIKIIFQNLLIGLWQMHQHDYYHMDVKCENMVVSNDGHFFLIGFGCSEKIIITEQKKALIKLEKDEEFKRFKANGDRSYFSPEREAANLNGDFFDASLSDSYSAGIALWELITGEDASEYREKNGSEEDHHKILLLHPALLQESSFSSSSSKQENDSLIDLVKKMLDPDLTKRWDIVKALKHPSLQSNECHDKEMIYIIISYLGKFVRAQNKKQAADRNSSEEQ